ncbi:hypothetical protein K458DRAFT_303623 [Lentithecium fluviatile CBS 122367]|uniref:Uncharacterized protein n=1 Tax=Lentithecium fluviatile CBS 122367 TaxID=1168545 RepID=A0A6G1J0L6_9PLEO|nr:hypothetical protein K458DRAFT_303623 [Lentithecium fluviatile CBS 122367]
MASLPPNSPCGLPSSPRAIRQALPTLNTNFRPTTSPGRYSDNTPEKQSASTFIDTRQRNRDSLIFVNATIPLSPASPSDSMEYKEQPFDGLVARRRNGFARLFCCFGSEERARRRAMRGMEYEKVGEKCHWTEM